MAVTSCLWVVTMRNIVGISMEKLSGWGKEVVDWKSISPLPYDFHLKLPQESMTPFVRDSKLFLAGGFIPHQPPDRALSSKIYELFFDMDNDRKKSLAVRVVKAIFKPLPVLVRLAIFMLLAVLVFMAVFKPLGFLVFVNLLFALVAAASFSSPGVPVFKAIFKLPAVPVFKAIFDVTDLLDRKKSFLLRISEAAPDSIPPPPTALPHSYIANVGGKVYLLVYDARSEFRMVKRKEGFWVLGSGGKEWQGLPGPPPMYLDGFGLSHAFFVLQDKLFFEASNVSEGNNYLYAFDTQTNKWYQLDDNIKKSFSFLEDERQVLFPSIMVASLPVPVPVTLSWTWKRLPDSQVRVKIYAMLLNNQDNSVFRYQSLDEVSEAIQPSCFTDYTTRLNFVDLGNGLVCALVNGFPPEHNHGTTPVLCVLVFALSFALDPPARTFRFGGKEQRFLDVDVRVNRVFTLANLRGCNFREDLEHAFIFPSKGTTSPPGNNRS